MADKQRIKNNGFHDLIVENDVQGDAELDCVFIRQGGRHTSVVVVSRVVVPLLIAALQETVRG